MISRNNASINLFIKKNNFMKKKTIILYRVIQEWRAPIFEKLGEEGWDY
jgi:hypothetical protein